MELSTGLLRFQGQIAVPETLDLRQSVITDQLKQRRLTLVCYLKALDY